MELTRSNLVITRKGGIVEHAIFVRPDGNKPPEHLVHLSILPSGHATVIDPFEHPGYHPEHTPEEQTARVKKFLDLGGHTMLGHPNAPETQAMEAAKLREKHGLTATPTI